MDALSLVFMKWVLPSVFWIGAFVAVIGMLIGLFRKNFELIKKYAILLFYLSSLEIHAAAFSIYIVIFRVFILNINTHTFHYIENISSLILSLIMLFINIKLIKTFSTRIPSKVLVYVQIFYFCCWMLSWLLAYFL